LLSKYGEIWQRSNPVVKKYFWLGYEYPSAKQTQRFNSRHGYPAKAEYAPKNQTPLTNEIKDRTYPPVFFPFT
jgi:hypothetical protein